MPELNKHRTRCSLLADDQSVAKEHRSLQPKAYRTYRKLGNERPRLPRLGSPILVRAIYEGVYRNLSQELREASAACKRPRFCGAFDFW